MSCCPVVLALPSTLSLADLKTRLIERLPVRDHGQRSAKLTYRDTFDWRLFRAGDIVETVPRGTRNRFIWRRIDDGKPHASLDTSTLPRFAWELPESIAWRRLSALLDIRALLPVLEIDSQVHSFSVLDKERKTTVSLEVLVDKPGLGNNIQALRYLRATPIRGFNKAFGKVGRILHNEFGLLPLAQDPFLLNMAVAGREPGASLECKDCHLKPDARCDDSLKAILRHLLNTIKHNEAGVRGDWDSEFLHDFRVAVRKTRSLLAQIKQVFATRAVARFKREFTWLGQITGPTRDMDVYLLDYNDYRDRLPPGIRDDLAPLREFLTRRQKAEHDRLVEALNSPRFKKFVGDWEAFLNVPSPHRTRLLNAVLPVAVVADSRIWKLYKRALKEGRAIDPQSPAEALHELRKTCKKLRYLMESFRSLFPTKQIKALIKILKILQDNLGEFQDLQVQQESLKGFEEAMAAEGMLIPAAEQAIDIVVEQMAEREQRVRADFDDRFKQFAAARNRRRFAALIHPKKQPTTDAV